MSTDGTAVWRVPFGRELTIWHWSFWRDWSLLLLLLLLVENCIFVVDCCCYWWPWDCYCCCCCCWRRLHAATNGKTARPKKNSNSRRTTDRTNPQTELAYLTKNKTAGWRWRCPVVVLLVVVHLLLFCSALSENFPAKICKTVLEHRESNPGRQSDSLECYPYTMPDLHFIVICYSFLEIEKQHFLKLSYLLSTTFLTFE